MRSLSTPPAPPQKKWEFELFGVPVALGGNPLDADRWDVAGDSRAFSDEDRRQWRLRLPGYIVADHLSAEPAFLAMVARVRASHDTAPVAWCEAACFSPRGGAEGGDTAAGTGSGAGTPPEAARRRSRTSC